ncbi:MAG TPA: FixH family protein [Nitrospira sp.]|nr:FixH family protein [Nitrospira sp.]
MRTMTRRGTRTAWIMIGVIIVAISLWLFEGRERFHPSQTGGMGSMQDVQRKAQGSGKEGMRPFAALEGGPAQAYAMITPFKQQLIGVKTSPVGKRRLETVVRAVGRVDYDEQRITRVNLRVSGWVEELFVDFTGQLVAKGQPLFTMYSPDLVASEDEYLLALKARDKVRESPISEARAQAEELVAAAHDRLRLWTLTDKQIDELARRGKAQTYITMTSPVTGHVIEKKAFKGLFVAPEMTLYTIADLSSIWVNAEIYEYEVPFVKMGQPATVTFAAYPGERFHGRVSFIYPYLNKEARTVKIRLELPNPDMLLKPDMYGDALIKIDRGDSLAIPEQAVLDSGTRTLVFVLRGEGLFEPRVVKLGPKIGSYYEVQEGLEEGEQVVTSGNFLVDSESKLMAATNMMGALGMGGIRMEQARMGEMDMGGQASEQTKQMAPVTEKKVGGMTMTLSTEPAAARIGENMIRIKLRDESGKPVTTAKVLLTYTMPMPGMMPSTIPMISGKDGVFEAKANLGMGGQWDLTVTIQRAGRPDIKESFSVIAGGGGMSGM